MLLEIWTTTQKGGKGELIHDVKMIGVIKNNYIVSYTLEDGSIHDVDLRYHSIYVFGDKYDYTHKPN